MPETLPVRLSIVTESATADVPDWVDRDDVAHRYPRPPRPGDRAYCGHLWTPDEAAAIWRGDPLPACAACTEGS